MLKVAKKDVISVNKVEICGGSPPSEKFIRETALKYCRAYLNGSWKKIQSSELILQKISGGLSNLLYCCQLPDNVPLTDTEPRRVLIRFYGQVNRDRALETLTTECVILTLLSERQRGPRLYGVFQGGRLEEYVPARPLETKEMAHPNISCRIAEKMAAIHLMDVPMHKSPKHMWENMDRWYETIQTVLDEEQTGQSYLCPMADNLQDLNIKSELAWLKSYVERVPSPVAFCHNDMQEGNILLRNGQGEPDLDTVTADDLVIIDFEYCCYNRRGFDIANHFMEWMYDYKNTAHPYFWARPAKDHATTEQKMRFVDAYLAALKQSPAYRPRPEDTPEHILKEIEVYSLASHFFWALWSVVSDSQLFSSSAEFDYWCYGRKRLEDYYSHKRKLLGTLDL